MTTLIETKRPARDYQLQCRDITLAHPGKRLYYVLPTGTGKTRELTLLIEKLQHQGRILVVAHRKELVEQTAASIREDIPGVDVGVVMAEQNDICAHIIVGTIQTLKNGRLEDILREEEETVLGLVCRKPIAAVLIDECHHAVPGSQYDTLIQRVTEVYPACRMIGCTATPFRSDKSRMQEVLTECSFMRSIADMQKAGWLAPLKWKAVKLPLSLSGLKTSQVEGERDYNPEALYGAIEPQTRYIVSQTAPHFGTRPAMVFSVNVAHAYELAAAYAEAGLKAVALDGTTPKQEREATLAAWKRGEYQVMCNCALFTEGFDYTPQAPNINGLGALVIACPTMSPSRYLQMVGRGTRIKPVGGDFTDCLVFDVGGNANLLETNQVTLPRVMPTCPVDDDQLDSGEFVTFDGKEEEEKKSGPRKSRLVRVNDPLTTSWVAWGHETEGDIYYTGLGTRSPAVYVAMVPDQAGTGLYHGLVLSEQDYKWTIQRITTRSKPLHEAMHHLNHIISSNGYKQLTDKNAKWRTNPATEKQLNWLKKLDAGLHQQACATRANCGEVGQLINWCLIRKPLSTELAKLAREA